MATEPLPVRPSTCGECPWRRASAPGWLGPYTPMEWVQLVGSDVVIACHRTIEDDNEITEATMQCAGAAQYRRNVGKLPRDQRAAVTSERDTATVFDSPVEFLAHHQPVDGYLEKKRKMME